MSIKKKKERKLRAKPQGVGKVCKDTQRINGDGGGGRITGSNEAVFREGHVQGSFEMGRVRHVQSTSKKSRCARWE